MLCHLKEFFFAIIDFSLPMRDESVLDTFLNLKPLTISLGPDTPDLSAFLYDATSGFYYDPQTTLYYDPNSRVSLLIVQSLC